MCRAYRGPEPVPGGVPDLARQERLNEELRRAEPVLVPTTAEGIVELLGGLARVVLTGHGPTHEGRRLAKGGLD